MKLHKNFINHLSASSRNRASTKGLITNNEKSITKNKESIDKLDSLCKSLIILVNDNKKINEKEIKLISEKFKSLKFIEGKTDVEFIEIVRYLTLNEFQFDSKQF